MSDYGDTVMRMTRVL